jgi:hypothetical protein
MTWSLHVNSHNRLFERKKTVDIWRHYALELSRLSYLLTKPSRLYMASLFTIQDKSFKISAYLIEGYSRNASYALHKISTFILFDVRYSVWNATEGFHLYFLLSRKITVLK